MINYISNLPRSLRTGGFSALNAAGCSALERRHEIAYVGPIDPGTAPLAKAVSKALRVTGLGGDFVAFSKRRLADIAEAATRGCRQDAALDFFHGFTPWIATRPARPYVAGGDCTFHDYATIFHDRARFRAEDLARIERAEAAWLGGARRVLFTSDWAAKRAIDRYGLDPGRVASVGVFGELEPPERDAFAGGFAFAFVSTDFAAKGGPTALAAFRRLRERHREARLVIVGASPGQAALGEGVSYAGFMRKEVPEELARFRQILGTCVAVVHPTRGDITPLVLVEAAMFGCPAIATRAFAIPELVEDGVTGRLLDPPATTEAVAAAMAWMLEQPDAYAAMRAAAWRRSRAIHAKRRFEARLLAAVDEALSEPTMAAA